MNLFGKLLRRRTSRWSMVTGRGRGIAILFSLTAVALMTFSLDQGLSSAIQLEQREMLVGSTRLSVGLADEPAEQSRGLSGRRSLSPGKGLVFTFENPAAYGFWMKEMNFPIDIVWIRHGLITQISPDVPPPEPGEKPVTVSPEQPVDMVLEVPAGYAKSQGWRPGTKAWLGQPLSGL